MASAIWDPMRTCCPSVAACIWDAGGSCRKYAVMSAAPVTPSMIEVRRCAGTQFDPAMAEAFLRVDPEEIRSLLREHQARTPRTVPTTELTK